MMILSFAFFLLLFVAIGAISSFYKKSNSSDYLLASNSIKPWLVGFAAVATNNSGYMFIGLIGFTYKFGLASMWLMIGGILGDFTSSLFCHKKLREISGKNHALSFTSAISNWHGKNYRKVQIIGAITTFIFLAAYAAAQLTAGGKALYVLFDWNYNLGIILGAVIILIYCFMGGIRASIWTNTAQAFVMILSMALVFFYAIDAIGGFSQFTQKLAAVSPDYLKIFPQNLYFGSFGIFLFIFGWYLGGITVVGQPHIMLDFMTMEKPKDITKIRFYYYSWYVFFSALTIGVGLSSRILLPEIDGFDSELAMPTLAQNLLPEILLGCVLAGLFSATMSTADSQILCCASALTHDLTKDSKKKNNYILTKLATIFSTMIALFIALSGDNSVFRLALVSWSVLAAVFAPLFVLFALGKKLTENECLIIIATSLTATFVWLKFDLSWFIYESAIGFFVGILTYFLIKLYHRIIS